MMLPSLGGQLLAVSLLVVLLLASHHAAAVATTSADAHAHSSATTTISDDDDADDDSCHCAADFVSRLPGLNQPLPSPWYSGFLTYPLQGRTIHTHYVLIKAEKESASETTTDYKSNDEKHKHKPQQPPLIYWSNGGPGASSLFGLMTELGPLLLSDDSLLTADYRSTGIPTPIYNPHSWTRLGHVLMFDQPAPVGFSYCDDDVNNSTSCLSWTDELASENAYAALQAFYEKFPCFADNDLYLTGESYGGIYIPTLARRIILQQAQQNQKQQAANSKAAMNLKGFAVGDGCLGTQTGICGNLASNPDGFNIFHVSFLFGHGQIPVDTFHQVLRACRPSPHNSDWLNAHTSACQAALQKVKDQAGGYYEYNLYDDCTYRNGILMMQQKQAQLNNNLLQGATNDYPCGGDLVLEQYLKMDTVREALHVPDNYFSVDNAVNFDYTPTEPDLRPFYTELTAQNQQQQETDNAVRILIYNGDSDPSITSLASQNWTSHLPLAELESWRPWTVDGCLRVGGYVTRYAGNLDFLTIRGAGHMVPTYKPDATFAFMSAWINNEDYPVYDKSCKSPPAPPSQQQYNSRLEDENAAVRNISRE